MLADQFFLIAHKDRTGRSRLHPRATGIGLAAALAGESALDNKRCAAAGDLEFVRNQPPRDELNHAVLDLLIAQPQHRDIRTWLADLVQAAAVKSLAKPRMLSTQTFLHAHVLGRVLDTIDQWAGRMLMTRTDPPSRQSHRRRRDGLAGRPADRQLRDQEESAQRGTPSHRVPAPLLRVHPRQGPGADSAGVSLS